MKHPLFSCVMPVKGRRPYFYDALGSLQSQGMGDELEIIVQDGDVEQDSGQSDALNKGFAKAHGEWLFWLNSDDLLLPGALCKVKKAIERQGGKLGGRKIEWITGNQLLIDEAGKILRCSVGNGWHDWLYRHAVPHVYGPSSFFRRSLLERVRGLDVSLLFCMDWDLWIRFMNAGARFQRIGAYLWAQRQWHGSKTQRKLPSDTQKAFWAEIRSMLVKNELHTTFSGFLRYRTWRLLNGNYAREAFDTLTMRGRLVSTGGLP